MQATYVGHRYAQWEMEGRRGEYTDVYLVKPFPLDEADGVGDKAVSERVKKDLRAKLGTFVVGEQVEIQYDAGRGGKAVLASIERVAAVAAKK